MSGQRQHYHGRRHGRNAPTDRADRDPNWRHSRSKPPEPFLPSTANGNVTTVASQVQQRCLTPHQEYVTYFRREWQQFRNELELERNGGTSTVERYVRKGTNDKLEGFQPFDINEYLAHRKAEM